jgi:RNA recognition motif-containing protein
MNIENKIFIGGLAPMTTQDSLINYFSQFGELSEAKLVMDKNTGQSKCYAFIFFKELADAQRAVEGGSAIIDGKRCNCNLASSHTAPQQQQQQQPQGDIPEVKKVFVGGIGPNTTRETVHAAFSQFGEVLECKVIVDQNTGFSKGYGFVEFISPISAQKATASGFISIDGKNCNCNLAFNDKGDNKTLDQGECKVFIGGLAPTVTSESLSVAMTPYGKVETCKVVLDKVTQVSKGFGFVEFASSKSAARATKNGFVLVDGKNCNCNIASQGGNNNNNNNNAAMSMGMGFGQMSMPYAMPYAMPMNGSMGFQSEPLGVDGLAYLKEQLYTVIQGSASTQVLFANTRMLLNSLESMYGGGDIAMQGTMTMQQPYYANPTTNLSLLKRPFGQQAESNEIKNKKPKPNDAQAWTPYTSLTGNFQQNQFDMTGGYRR